MTTRASFDRPLSVLVADPNDVSRAGLRALLGADPRFAVVGETADDVRTAAHRLQPDLIVLDPDVDGCLDVPLIAELVREAPASSLCIRTAVVEPRSVLDAMLAGTRVYLLKSNPNFAPLPDVLALAGRFGAVVVDPTIAAHLRGQTAGKFMLQVPAPEAVRLSCREREVLALVADGMTDKAIAGQLNISVSTVQTYVARLVTKLGASNRTHLVALAVRRGLLFVAALGIPLAAGWCSALATSLS